MADWHQFAQSVVLGFIFSFLLAKLFSVIFSFRDDNLRIVRRGSDSSEGDDSKPALAEPISGESGATKVEMVRVAVENEASKGEKERLSSGSSGLGLGESDDDWEGVESTELDEAFSAATAFVAATAADRAAQKVSNDVQLQLYGLYKIATEGPCSAPQPSALKMTARAKWQAWQKLGAMPTEEAMQKYIAIVSELYPTWAIGHAVSKGSSSTNAPTTDSKGPMGPVFSTLVYEEGSGNELKMDAIHAFAREGDEENLLKCIETGVSVNQKDSEGRTPLHWAVDRGQLKITELLIRQNTDVNAQDNEGQTPLHYAAVCDREAIAEFLVSQNADIHLKDNDGSSPYDLCESNWPCMQNKASATD